LLHSGQADRLGEVKIEAGMGSVWLADHLTLGVQVAVKFVSQPRADASLLHRFRQEATSAAKIRHPHVIQVFDHGVTEDGYPYIVMELLAGRPWWPVPLAWRSGRRGCSQGLLRRRPRVRARLLRAR
jgi:hypothetical protein